MIVFRSTASALLVALAAIAAPAGLASQTDSSKVFITGTVLDPLRRPIEGVEVRVVGTNASATTAAAGTFRIFAPRAKEILLQIRRPGYNAQLLKLDGDWSGTVLLQPGAFKLPEVEVTARYAKPAQYAGTAKYDDYFRRRRAGFGEFIDREEIERRGAMRTAEILQGRAGIKAEIRSPDSPALVAFARCNENPPKISVYVDGHKLITGLQMESGSESILSLMSRGGHLTEAELENRRRMRLIVGEQLDRVNPSDIELVEIFRGPGELPPEFNDGNCGAIVIWTREGGR